MTDEIFRAISIKTENNVYYLTLRSTIYSSQAHGASHVHFEF